MSQLLFMEAPKLAGECLSFQGLATRDSQNVSRLLEDFLEYARFELNFSPQTIIKYRDSLRSFIRDIGDKPVESLEMQDFVRLKKLMVERGISGARISSIIYAIRSFLTYCREFLQMKTLEPKKIRPPKILKREVIFLTKEEIERLLGTINTKSYHGLRFRALA